MDFGSNIVRLREEAGISRKELAEKLEIPYTTLRNYETNKREPGHKTLIKLSQIFKVSTDELIGGETQGTKGQEKEEFATLGELTEKEQRFISTFTALSPANRHILSVIAEALLRDQARDPEPQG